MHPSNASIQKKPRPEGGPGGAEVSGAPLRVRTDRSDGAGGLLDHLNDAARARFDQYVRPFTTV